MKKLKPLQLIALFLSLSLQAICQDGPPPMAMPADSNAILITNLIKVTDHEAYFLDYCTNKVKDHGLKQHWSTKKTQEILASIKFDYYSTTIYNSYAFYTKSQLTKLLEAMTLLKANSKDRDPLILTNSMMQWNLERFVENIIEGKYL
jgi:hypothetical protein